jgi:UDP-N-acetyl-D-mannosaminuronic acid dehydrogenase
MAAPGLSPPRRVSATLSQVAEADGAFSRDVVVVGGCGHVGLPLALAFAARGLRVTSYDISAAAVAQVNSGVMPFQEPGADELLKECIESGRFDASDDPAVAGEAEVIVVVIGTPVDEHQNPDPDAVRRAVSEIADRFRDGQLLVLRSTVYPGVTRLVADYVASTGCNVDVAFCPERIAEGKALVELYELPQLVSGITASASERASKLFRLLTDQIVEVEPEEAELAKLFTNAWRYIKFAAANQFFMIANNFGLDYERVRNAITFDYPRAADLPGAGFAAGPCLFKDTAQLAAFNTNNFPLGNASMLVNEGLPLYLVAQIEGQHDLSNMTVGILGMAFKGESDDTRSSLSYKLRRILRFKAREVICSDPYVSTDPALVPLDEALERADLLIIGAPHARYAEITTDKPVVDMWNLLGEGVRV